MVKPKTLDFFLQSLNFPMYVGHHYTFSHASRVAKYYTKHVDNLYWVIDQRRAYVTVRRTLFIYGLIRSDTMNIGMHHTQN